MSSGSGDRWLPVWLPGRVGSVSVRMAENKVTAPSGVGAAGGALRDGVRRRARRLHTVRSEGGQLLDGFAVEGEQSSALPHTRLGHGKV